MKLEELKINIDKINIKDYLNTNNMSWCPEDVSDELKNIAISTIKASFESVGYAPTRKIIFIIDENLDSELIWDCDKWDLLKAYYRPDDLDLSYNEAYRIFLDDLFRVFCKIVKDAKGLNL